MGQSPQPVCNLKGNQMNVQLFPQEVEMLSLMCGGSIPESVNALVIGVKRRMYAAGASHPISKELAAVLAMLGANMGEMPEPPMPVIEVPETEHATTPVDNDLMAEGEEYQSGGNGDSYFGTRIKWETVFKSTPNTPVAELEKGRPITYVDDDGTIRSAKFVRILPKDKRKAVIMSSKKKKPYSIDVARVQITDLSPPSTVPRAVQI